MTRLPDATELWARRVLWTLTVLTFVFTGMLVGMSFESRERRRSVTWRRLRQCAIAVDNYAYQNGTAPYDERGPEYALYALYEANQQLPAEIFSTEHDPTPATWDHSERKLVSGDIAYANVATSDSHMVILIAPASAESGCHLVATLDSSIRLIPADGVSDPQAFLGTYHLFDLDLYFSAKALKPFDSLPDGEFQHCVRSEGRILTAFYDWGRVTYQYTADGRLRGRQIIPNNGESRMQRITTDENGIIVSINDVDSESPSSEAVPVPMTGVEAI